MDAASALAAFMGLIPVQQTPQTQTLQISHTPTQTLPQAQPQPLYIQTQNQSQFNAHLRNYIPLFHDEYKNDDPQYEYADLEIDEVAGTVSGQDTHIPLKRSSLLDHRAICMVSSFNFIIF